MTEEFRGICTCKLTAAIGMAMRLVSRSAREGHARHRRREFLRRSANAINALKNADVVVGVDPGTSDSAVVQRALVDGKKPTLIIIDDPTNEQRRSLHHLVKATPPFVPWLFDPGRLDREHDPRVRHDHENYGDLDGTLMLDDDLRVWGKAERPKPSDWIGDWWRDNRMRWGRLQQVRKGTRVRCWFCSGGGRQCPLCDGFGFLGRDEALEHLEMEMEMAHK